MERGINDYFGNEKLYMQPYSNHMGHGCNMGCGDEFGNGRAYTVNFINDDYSGSDIISFNGNKTYFVNGYLLYLTHVRLPWATGKIIKNDLTTQDCYIGKINNLIVVSDSIKNVSNELREKINKEYSYEVDLAEAFFMAHPDFNKEYDWNEMVQWHMLAGSCEDGRRRFTENSNKKNGDKATPKELIELMKNSTPVKLAEKMEEIYLYND